MVEKSHAEIAFILWCSFIMYWRSVWRVILVIGVGSTMDLPTGLYVCLNSLCHAGWGPSCENPPIPSHTPAAWSLNVLSTSNVSLYIMQTPMSFSPLRLKAKTLWQRPSMNIKCLVTKTWELVFSTNQKPDSCFVLICLVFCVDLSFCRMFLWGPQKAFEGCIIEDDIGCLCWWLEWHLFRHLAWLQAMNT